MTTHGLRRLPFLAFLMAGLASAADTSSPARPAPAAATPAGDTTEVTASASGPSRDHAIANALASAVTVVQGPSAPNAQLSAMFLQAMRDERMVRMTMASDNRLVTTRLSTAVAFVQDYQVQDSRRGDAGGWTARVRARVVVPEARLARNRAGLDIAVLPFSFMQNDEAEAAGMAAQKAQKQTEADVLRFGKEVAALLDHHPRVELHALPANADDAIGKAADAPGEVNWLALRDSTGANRFVTVQVEDFRAEAVRLKGKGLTARIDGGYTLHYRLIGLDPAGKAEILRSGTFSADTRNPWLRPLAMTTSTEVVTADAAGKRIAALQSRVADLFSRTLLSEMVLPQVISREGEQVILQPGASVLRPGDTLAVLGPDLVDADDGSGLATRLDGLRIAVVQVTESHPDRLLARVTKGEAFAVQPGSLLRRIGAVSSGIAAAAIPGTSEPRPKGAAPPP